jgi:hypothetical protein
MVLRSIEVPAAAVAGGLLQVLIAGGAQVVDVGLYLGHKDLVFGTVELAGGFVVVADAVEDAVGGGLMGGMN